MTEGGRTKNTPDKTFQVKKTQTKAPANKRQTPPVKTYVRMHVVLKIGGSEMCDVL